MVEIETWELYNRGLKKITHQIKALMESQMAFTCRTEEVKIIFLY